MSLATVDDIRSIANIPSGVEDSVLSPHLETASRELKKWIGAYDSATGDKRTKCIEAESCLAFARALPSLNTFFTAGVTKLQKEIGDLDFQFHSVDEMKDLQQEWRDRAQDAVSEWMNQGRHKRIGFYAI